MSTEIFNKFSLLWAEGPEHSLGWYSHFVKIIIRKMNVHLMVRIKLERRQAAFIFEFEPISFNL